MTKVALLTPGKNGYDPPEPKRACVGEMGFELPWAPILLMMVTSSTSVSMVTLLASQISVQERNTCCNVYVQRNKVLGVKNQMHIMCHGESFQ